MAAPQITAQTFDERGQQWKQMLPLKRLRTVAIPWTLVLIGGSLMGGSAKTLIGTHSFHRAYHLGSFGATAALYMVLARTAAGEIKGALAAMGLGLSIEALQHWIYAGRMEWWDVRDDAIGIAAALLLMRSVARLTRQET